MPPTQPPRWLRTLSYRQMNYWASRGALGPEHMGVGSGHHRLFSEWEKAKLNALGRLSRDLREVCAGGGLSTEVVAWMWKTLDKPGDGGKLTVGGISLTINVTPEDWPVEPLDAVV